MLNSKEEIIDGVKFISSQFPAMRSFALLGRLVKTIGPAISVLSSADPNAEISDIAPQIAVALKDLEPDALTALAVDILALTEAVVNGPQGPRKVSLNDGASIDAVFTGKLGMMFKVLGFVVKLNYADFFAGSVPRDVALPAAEAATH